MLKFSLTIVLLAFFTSAYSQSCTQKAPPADVQKMQSLIGDWQGVFTDHGITTALSIKFYEENGELKLKINNAAITPLDVMADASLCSTNKFHFFGKRIDGQSFTYNAWLKNGELVGDYKIGESCSKENRSAFKLKKIKTG